MATTECVAQNVMEEAAKEQPKSTTSTTKPAEEPSCFDEWCQMTGWHGILDFYKAKEIGVKIGWLTIVFCGFILAINQSVSLISEFVSSEPWTTSIIYETTTEIDWPNLMVCGLAWPGAILFQNSVPQTDFDAMSTMLGRNQEENRRSANLYKIFDQEQDLIGVENIYANLTSEIIGDHFNQTEYDFNICSKVVIHCGAMSNFNLKNETNCCKDSSERLPQTACFHLNSTSAFNSSKDTVKSGMFSGVYYLLNPELQDYYGNILYPGVGVRLQLYYGRVENSVDQKLGFALTPGTHHTVVMTNEVRRTVRPDRAFSFYKPTFPCDRPFKYAKIDNYTNYWCNHDCTIQWQINFCKCYSTFDKYVIPMKNLNNQRECNKTESVICWKWHSDAERIFNTPESSFLMKCRKECPETCDFSTIDAKMSSSLFLAPNKVSFFTTYFNKAIFGNKSGTNFTEDQVRQLILLEMYYETGQNRVFEKRVRIPIEELLSNIGGCMGVWSGISLISIVQIFFYIFQCVRKRAQRPTFLNKRWTIKCRKVTPLKTNGRD